MRAAVRQENREFMELSEAHHRSWYIEMTLYASVTSVVLSVFNLLVSWRSG